MVQLSPRLRRQQKTRRLILDAARRIIAEQGVDALSMRQLAERIEYSPSGIYEYFESKEEILLTLNREGHRQLTEALARTDQSVAADQYLQQIGLAYIQFATENPDLYQVMFSRTPQISTYADVMDEGSSFMILLQAIRNGLDQGIFRAREGFGLYEMAYAAWSLVHGIAMMRIYQRSFPPDFERVKLETLAVLGRGLMAS